MSRGQKRQYGGGGGYTEYYEQDFVGFRDNNNHHNNQTNQNFQGGGRSSGGWSGRGRGMRKHQQSRICYVNAEFINQHNTPDLQNLHGVRRRGKFFRIIIFLRRKTKIKSIIVLYFEL